MVEQERKKYLSEGEKASIITMFCNIILIIVKIISGLFIGSIALLASGFDALTDLVASFAVIIGLRYAQKDPSKKFPYGYYRLETLATLVIAILILIFGIDVIYQSFNAFINPTAISQPLIGIIVALFSIIAAFGLYRYNLRIGKKISSNALISSAKEFQFDIITNSLIFIGLLFHTINIPELEGIIGVIIGLIIIRAGLGFGKSAVFVLIDALDDPQLIDKMREIISQFSEIQKIENIRIRQSGPFYFADIEVQMAEKETLKDLSIVIHAIEDRLKEFNPRFDTIMISVEPFKKMKIKVAVPTDSTSGSLEKLPVAHFGIAPAFMIIEVDLQSQTVLSSYMIENPHFNEDKKRGILAAELLVNEEIDILLVKDPETFGKGPKAILNENKIELHQYIEHTISENLQRLIVKLKKNNLNNSIIEF